MDKSLIESYIRSLRPILYIQSNDFKAIGDELGKVADDSTKRFMFMEGLGALNVESRCVEKEATLSKFLYLVRDEGYNQPSFIILQDVHSSLDRPDVISQLRYIAERTLYKDDYQATVFILSAVQSIPRELEHLITLVPLITPKQHEIESFISAYAKRLDFAIDRKDLGELSLELKGLSLFQIKQILDLAYTDGGLITSRDRRLIMVEKKQIIQKSGLLEYIETSKDISIVGGLENLKEWLEQKSRIISRLDAAIKYGVDMPKGILIVGFPGCGKSLVAKTTSVTFKLPLLRLDVGKILGKYVGESEQNMRLALTQAEAISPCVLWVDEVEKAFGGGDNSNNHEVTTRLVGQFLTWMQEKNATVFVVATANDLDRLPTEFLRKGRFDEIFSVALPNDQERFQILKIHLKQRQKYASTLNLNSAIAATKDFSGADIEAGVSGAVEKLFLSGDTSLTEELLLESLKKITPLSQALQKKFSAMEDKLKEYNVRPASQ